jgi:GTPase SAR1 family protein
VATSSSSAHPMVSYMQTPPSSSFFTGRQRYLEKLKDYFGLQVNQQPVRRRFLLYGMGGVGKTQICVKFIEENSDL